MKNILPFLLAAFCGLAAAQGHVEQALKINPNYGRGAIALGNLQFDRGDLFGARQTYLTAAALPNQPPDALVGVKAAQGLGNVHLRQLIGVQPTPGPAWPRSAAIAPRLPRTTNAPSPPTPTPSPRR